MGKFDPTAQPNRQKNVMKLQQAELLIKRFNDLGYHMYKKLGQQRDGSVCVSPVSVGVALGLVFDGAENATKAQLANLSIIYDNVKRELLTKLDADVLKIVVSILLNSKTGKSVKTTFADTNYNNTLVTYFIKDVDSEEAASNFTIPRDFFSSTRKLESEKLVLVASPMFIARWPEAMKVKWSSRGKLLTKTDRFMWGKDAELDAEFVFLPFKDKSMHMILIKPSSDSAMRELELALTAEKIREWRNSSAKEETVEVGFPPFVIDTSTNLKEVFPGFKYPLDRMFASDAELNKIVGVDKVPFTTAASNVYLSVGSAGINSYEAAEETSTDENSGEKFDKQFHVYDSFMFAIRHEKSNMLLFIGRRTVQKETAGTSGASDNASFTCRMLLFLVLSSLVLISEVYC